MKYETGLHLLKLRLLDHEFDDLQQVEWKEILDASLFWEVWGADKVSVQDPISAAKLEYSGNSWRFEE